MRQNPGCLVKWSQGLVCFYVYSFGCIFFQINYCVAECLWSFFFNLKFLIWTDVSLWKQKALWILIWSQNDETVTIKRLMMCICLSVCDVCLVSLSLLCLWCCTHFADSEICNLHVFFCHLSCYFVQLVIVQPNTGLGWILGLKIKINKEK